MKLANARVTVCRLETDMISKRSLVTIVRYLYLCVVVYM